MHESTCVTYSVLIIASGICAVLLLLHHYYKHTKDLHGYDRLFQPEDVCVLCVHHRFSHEMFVCLCLGVALVFIVLLSVYC